MTESPALSFKYWNDYYGPGVGERLQRLLRGAEALAECARHAPFTWTLRRVEKDYPHPEDRATVLRSLEYWLEDGGGKEGVRRGMDAERRKRREQKQREETDHGEG